MGSSASEREKRRSVDSMHRPLKSWLDMELVLSSSHEAIKMTLKLEVVEGLFSEKMGYSGMTMFALEDQPKVSQSEPRM